MGQRYKQLGKKKIKKNKKKLKKEILRPTAETTLSIDDIKSKPSLVAKPETEIDNHFLKRELRRTFFSTIIILTILLIIFFMIK